MRDHGANFLFAVHRDHLLLRRHASRRLSGLGNPPAPSRLHLLQSGGQLMDTAAEFRKHAVDCNTMAKVSNDPESKDTWQRMAERWLLCATLAEEDEQSLVRL